MHALTLLLLLAAADDAGTPPPAAAPSVAPAAATTPASTPSAAPAPTSPAAPEPPGTPPPAARAPAPPPPARIAPVQPLLATPFRLSLGYTRVLNEDGPLVAPGVTTQAIGLEMAFPSGSYVRNHLVLGQQWETAPGYSARGFRIDLISMGYPIDLTNGAVHVVLEPILTVLRGEILFVANGPRVLRLDSGFALDLSVAFRRWFVSVAPEIDFRYLIWDSNGHRTGFSRIIPLRIAIGHEF